MPLTIDYPVPHAHNWWLQLTFNFGIPVGIMFLAGLVLYIRTFIKMLKHGEEDYACIMGCFVVMFIVFGTFEVDYYPGQLPFILFFLLFKFVLDKNKEVIE